MTTKIDPDGIDIQAQDLSAVTTDGSDHGRIFYHDGSSNITLVSGRTTAKTGFFSWDNNAGAWFMVSEGDTQEYAERNLQPEGSQTGLVADSTGIKYEGKVRQLVDTDLLRGAENVYIEAATASSAGDEDVTVEIYDDTAGAVADSFVITGGSPRKRSADILASLTGGNEVHVRWNVTTASATSGATFDALGARLVIE